MKNYQQMLPPLLEAGIQVLIYAGDCGKSAAPPVRHTDSQSLTVLARNNTYKCLTHHFFCPCSCDRLHLQLPWQQGVDAGSRLAWQGRLQQGRRQALDGTHPSPSPTPLLAS